MFFEFQSRLYDNERSRHEENSKRTSALKGVIRSSHTVIFLLRFVRSRL